MAYLKNKLPSSPILLHFLLLWLLLSRINALQFNFPSFESNQTSMKLEGHAHYMSTSLHLTSPTQNSAGRALYPESMQLWNINGNTRRVADFTTHFTFRMSKLSGFNGSGHGLAFVLINENATFSNNSIGGLLGLFESEESGRSSSTTNYVVAVEFDTYRNKEWDETDNHMGINENSLRSNKYVNVPGGFTDQGVANVWVVYNSITKNLSAFLTLAAPGSFASHNVSYLVDLSTVLPQRVRVGFTAATRQYVQTHELYSWSFVSKIEDPAGFPPVSTPIIRKKVSMVFVIAITASLLVVILIFGVTFWWFRLRKNVISRASMEESPIGPKIEYHGPKRFTYLELSNATNDYDKELMLGGGGFGDVYRGKIRESNEIVAVKRFRNGSSQGEKEYVSEINVISMLKHKNLVQLKGWCHENRELLLVYEFMPNRSLDFHLFGKNSQPLTWQTRYKIVVDLASALHYLQDGCDPFVLHRDIKSSNIMLDSNFNAKLGDFGLARLTNQEQNFKTTLPAGTLGYLAPEVIASGKVSKATDIYSFGVVTLEIATGKRPVFRSKEDGSELILVEWVWDLYGKGLILEAVDIKLDGKFDEDEARKLMILGLWCCHPDPVLRPSVKQVQTVLNFEATEPSLPPTIPKPTYVSSVSNISLLLSNGSMDTETGNATTVSHVYTSSGTSITTQG